MKSAAVKAQNLVYRAAEPFLPNDKPGEQIYRAYRRLRAKQMRAGWSRVRNAYYGNVGEPTYLALKAQAERVGLLEQNTTEPCGNDADYLTRLQTAAGRQRAKGTEAGRLEAEAFEFAIRQLSNIR